MKKCSELIKDITDYMSQHGDVKIFIENDIIKQDCKHDDEIIEKYDGYTEGKDLFCKKCGEKVGYRTCFGKEVKF